MITAALPEDADLSKETRAALKAIHSGAMRSGQLTPQLSLKVAQLLLDGFYSGYERPWPVSPAWTDPENRLGHIIQQNVYRFSAARSIAQMKDMSLELQDKEGKQRSFREFEQAVAPQLEAYNRQWLRSEYQLAVNSAHGSASWNDYQESKDIYPNLIYFTVGDDRVRDEHQQLDGISRPIDDAFWNIYFPPNGWGCRCDVSQDDGPVTPAHTAQQRALSADVKPLFRHNPGKSGIVYAKSHPYFKAPDGSLEELEAVKHYGMKEVSAIYADPSKLSQRKTPAGFSWPGGEPQYYRDRNKNLWKAERSVTRDQGAWQDVPRTLSSPSEVWTRGGDTYYVKYFQDRTYLVRGDDKMRIKDWKVVIPADRETIDNWRMGALMYRGK